jgi:hypothetical protein
MKKKESSNKTKRSRIASYIAAFFLIMGIFIAVLCIFTGLISVGIILFIICLVYWFLVYKLNWVR